jgi:hypothetical protein
MYPATGLVVLALVCLVLSARRGGGTTWRRREGLASCAPDKAYDESKGKCVCDKAQGLKYSKALKKCAPEGDFDLVAQRQDCEARGKYFWEGKCLSQEYASKVAVGGAPRTAEYNADLAKRQQKGQSAEQVRKLKAAGYTEYDKKTKRYCLKGSTTACISAASVEATTKDARQVKAYGIGNAGLSEYDVARAALIKAGWKHSGWGPHAGMMCKNSDNTGCVGTWEEAGKAQVRNAVLADVDAQEDKMNAAGKCWWGGREQKGWVRTDKDNCCAKSGCACRNTNANSGKGMYTRSWAVGMGTSDSCTPKQADTVKAVTAGVKMAATVPKPVTQKQNRGAAAKNSVANSAGTGFGR